MITRDLLKQIIIDQQNTHKLPTNYVPRNLEKTILQKKDNLITIISGIRRVGKSSLLLALKQKLGGDYYVNFDDERFTNFTHQNFQLLLEVLIELFGEQKYMYFDEIQNIPGWERFVRRMFDSGKKIFVTGSNASMLSRELGTHLTGRYIQYELLPFSFSEFLRAQNLNIDPTRLDTKNQVKLIKAFNKYLNIGGIPYYVLNQDPLFLKDLFQGILYRDIIIRFNIKNEKNLKDLALYTMSNYSTLISARNLAKSLNFRSHHTLIKYLDYLEQAYVLFLIPLLSASIKQQVIAPKKLYVIDLGLANSIGFQVSENLGQKLENLVFLHLKTLGIKNIFYYADSNSECDFVTTDPVFKQTAIQVTAYLTPDNKEREINGLLNALSRLNVDTGYIVTLDQQETIKQNHKTIHVVPIYKWLLDKNSFKK